METTFVKHFIGDIYNVTNQLRDFMFECQVGNEDRKEGVKDFRSVQIVPSREDYYDFDCYVTYVEIIPVEAK